MKATSIAPSRPVAFPAIPHPDCSPSAVPSSWKVRVMVPKTPVGETSTPLPGRPATTIGQTPPLWRAVGDDRDDARGRTGRHGGRHQQNVLAFAAGGVDHGRQPPPGAGAGALVGRIAALAFDDLAPDAEARVVDEEQLVAVEDEGRRRELLLQGAARPLDDVG